MNVFYHMSVQDYTVAPVVANFTPVHRSIKQLRSSMLVAANDDEDKATEEMKVEVDEATEEINVDEDEATEEINVVPAPERLYAVNAATPQGYYIVKCLKVKDSHKFLGMYLSQVSKSDDSDNIVFKESRDKDHFEFATIVSEINYSLMPSNTRYSLLYVAKVELNDVIETIAEIDHD